MPSEPEDAHRVCRVSVLGALDIILIPCSHAQGGGSKNVRTESKP
jgi:hypothetical protein